MSGASVSGEETAGASVSSSDAATAGVGTASRLVMTRMRLENFKSYRGVVTLGPFHSQFSCIVGPNGSGKSNIIDGLLFVFGKAAKQLRHKKVAELIHCSSSSAASAEDAAAGEEGGEALEFAKVTVSFVRVQETEGGADGEEVEVVGSALSISRTAFRDGSSRYEMNGSVCTRKAVRDRLRAEGVDIDTGRFLILQGEVELISMMKPKAQTQHEEGLLEFLEDLIGSDKYVELIDEVAEEVSQLNETRIERLNRVKATEKERDNLEEAKAEVEAFLGKERAIRHKESTLWQVQQHGVQTEVDALEEEKKELEERQQHESDKLTTTEERLGTIEAEYKEKTAAYDALYANMQQAQAQFSEFEKRDIKYREDMKHQKNQIKKFQAAGRRERKKHEDAEARADTMRAEVELLHETMAELEETKQTAESRLDEINAQLADATAELRQNMEAKMEQLQPLASQVSGLRAQMDSVRAEVAMVEEKSERAREELEKVDEKLRSLSGDEQEQRDRLAHLEEFVPRTRRAIEEREQEAAALAERMEQLSTEIQRFIAMGEEQRAALRSAGGNDTVSRLLAAVRAGHLGNRIRNHVHGRLGDLATIDEQYDVAVSSACGTLNYIVVDTEDNAKTCIDYLRANNMGRADFIALTRMEQYRRRLEQRVDTPAGASRLLDLIQPEDERFTLAYYHAVQDTLVAENLVEAKRVADDSSGRRWRIVTLQGQMIETSGAMSGGGKPKQGLMRLTGMASSASAASATGPQDITEESIQSLEQNAAELQSELTECRAQHRAALNDAKKLTRDANKAELECQKLGLSLAGFDDTRADLTQRREELASQCDMTAEEQEHVRELQKQLTALAAELRQVEPQTQTLEEEVSTLQKEILDIGGPELKRQKKCVADAANAWEKARDDLTKAEVEISTAKRMATKAEKAATKAEADLQSAQVALTQVQEDLAQMEDDALPVHQAMADAKQACEEKEKDLSAIQEEFKTLQTTVDQVKEVLVDMREQMDELVTGIKERTARIAHWSEQLAATREAHEADRTEFSQWFKRQQQQMEELHSRRRQSAVARAEESKDNADEGSSESKSMEAPENEIEEEEAEGSVVVTAVDDDEHDNDNDEANLAAFREPVSEEQAAAGVNLSPLQKLSAEDCAEIDVDSLRNDIALLTEERDQLRSGANMEALEEYRRKDDEYKARLTSLEEISEARNAKRREYEALRRKRLEEFMEGFGQITLKLKEMYQMITLGGDAELELVDSLDPFSEGIVFSVRPPKKSWKNISNLSGGEKTLASLALIFALHHYKPTPLYVMDEIDAALDFKNVSIVANYIKERTKNAQFVIISLRNNMFELADRLVGVYKTDNATNTVTITPQLIAESCTSRSRKVAPAVTAPGASAAQVRHVPLADRTNRSAVGGISDAQEVRGAAPVTT